MRHRVHRRRVSRWGKYHRASELAVVHTENPGGSRGGVGGRLRCHGTRPVRPEWDVGVGPANDEGVTDGYGRDDCLHLRVAQSGGKCHCFCLFSALKEKERFLKIIQKPIVKKNSQSNLIFIYSSSADLP